ncbi:MAG: HlyD family efflux transporter periplasmic adaptor subunit [Candidatus Cryptobacteroides sp.]|nr:HlyD family efflux transporter periplasmic adaptor subunit [Bacteroidales bacterium]MDY4725507.1 HlyD family efflux transporter periplasmic adaptor subunit [Candidatus Cryptobacteroides sp.]
MKRSFAYPLLVLLAASCVEGNKAYDASGVFESTEVTVSAEGNGKILSLDIQEGDRLEAGQIVGCIDTVQLHLSEVQLEASRRAVGSGWLDISRQIAALESQIGKQRQELDRFTKLEKAGASNRKQVEDIQAQIETLERQLAAQEESLNSSNRNVSGQADALEAQIEQIRDRIRKCVITSPVAGTVLAKYSEAGEFAALGRALFKVADIDNIRLRAYITADQLTTLKLGQQVRVFADQGSSGRKEYAGTLIWISDKAEFTPKTIQTRDERANLVYAVKIAVENDGLIKLGMYGDIKF